jgi:hypothetical protein
VSVEWNNLDQIGRAELTGYQAGKRDEKERIIKLLEQHYLETQIQADIRGQIVTQSYSTDLIALIKGEGENK